MKHLYETSMRVCKSRCGTPYLSLMVHAGLLRIDNSGRSVIYTFDHNSETALVIITCDIPNEKEYFSLSFDISVTVIIFHLIFVKFKFDFFFTFIF